MFGGRHFPKDIILLCVRWYLAYPLSYRNIEEIMLERGINVGHTTPIVGLSILRLNLSSFIGPNRQ